MKKIIGFLFLIVSLYTFSEVKAPEFILKDQYGVEHSIATYKGKLIFLNFWATWCPPCQEEMPYIEELYKKYGENKKDVIFLGVNSEELESVKKFLKDNGYTFPTVIGDKIFNEYYIRAFPTTFIVDSDGNIYRYVVGALEKQQMEFLIQEGLKKVSR